MNYTGQNEDDVRKVFERHSMDSIFESLFDNALDPESGEEELSFNESLDRIQKMSANSDEIFIAYRSYCKRYGIQDQSQKRFLQWFTNWIKKRYGDQIEIKRRKYTETNGGKSYNKYSGIELKEDYKKIVADEKKEFNAQDSQTDTKLFKMLKEEQSSISESSPEVMNKSENPISKIKAQGYVSHEHFFVDRIVRKFSNPKDGVSLAELYESVKEFGYTQQTIREILNGNMTYTGMVIHRGDAEQWEIMTIDPRVQELLAREIPESSQKPFITEESFINLIQRLDNLGDGVPFDEIVQKCKSHGLNELAVKTILDKLVDVGKLGTPKHEHYHVYD